MFKLLGTHVPPLQLLLSLVFGFSAPDAAPHLYYNQQEGASMDNLSSSWDFLGAPGNIVTSPHITRTRGCEEVWDTETFDQVIL